jgi:CheY-like chemotaxis protein
MPRILVADDDAVQLELRKLLLQAAGHEVYLAYSAKQTLRRLSEHGADLIMLDLRFPNAKGNPDRLEGLKLIRQIHQDFAGTPMLVLSGWPDDIDGTPEERMVARVLVKPVKPSALIQAVREILP